MDIYGLITPPVAVPNGSAEPLGSGALKCGEKCCVWNIETATDIRFPEFAADTAASTVWCFEALVAFHHFPSRSARRRARRAHRLDLETKTRAERRALFFPSRRAGGAVVPPVR
jgi:hypothetical protein